MSHPTEEAFGTDQSFEANQFEDFSEDNSEELDSLLEDDEDTDGTDEGKSKAARTGKTSNRALIRKVAQKAEELAGATAKDKKLLAEILGSNITTADLTVAVILSTRSSLTAVTDLKEIAEAKPMRAVMTATAIGRARQKPLYSLLVHLGKLTGTPNNSEAKAGLDIAEAIFELSKEQHEALDRAVALAKR
jgi:hypothetical protein